MIGFVIRQHLLKPQTVCGAIQKLSVRNLLTKDICWRNFANMSDEKRSVYVTRPDVPEIGIELLKKELSVTVWEQASPVPREELLKQVVGKHALFVTLVDKIDAELLDKAGPQLKCIGTISVGYDHIDLVECGKRGIRVGYTPTPLTDATAELSVALLLAATRRLFEANREVYNGGWKSWSPGWMCGQGVKNKRIGFFGFGRIGRQIASRLMPFKPCHMTYTTRTETKEAEKYGVVKVDFDEMLRESDMIMVCSSLTPETKGIFNEAAFEKMKSNCVFVNTARGPIVDQTALYCALKEKRIMAAGIDVTTPEPLPLDDPLLELNNVVILPHIGSSDVETRIEMSEITAKNILAGLNGKEMVSEIKA